MDRLTSRTNKGIAYLVNVKSNEQEIEGSKNTLECLYNSWQRLADLEDEIERGELVKLPCKVGDKVWLKVNDYNTSIAEVVAIRIEQQGTLVKLQYFIEHSNDKYKKEIRFHYVDFNDFGKKVFLTEDEAMPKPAEVKE